MNSSAKSACRSGKPTADVVYMGTVYTHVVTNCVGLARYLEFIATQLQLPITAELTVKETDEETGKVTNKTFEAFRPFDMMKLPHADKTLLEVRISEFSSA